MDPLDKAFIAIWFLCLALGLAVWGLVIVALLKYIS